MIETWLYMEGIKTDVDFPAKLAFLHFHPSQSTRPHRTSGGYAPHLPL